jgi:ABC-type sugar transport system substrate-binding protein
MTRNAKLFIATLATVLAATLGTAGVAASADAAGKAPGGVKMYRDSSWCC